MPDSAIADSTAAASATVRACGPTVSCVCEIGITPCRLVRPTVGLMPTTPLSRRRAHDRAVGLAAERRHAQVGRDRHARAGARPARDCGRARTDSASVARGRSSRSTTATSGSWPTRSGWSCPVHRAGVPQPRDDGRVVPRPRVQQRQRAGRGLHAIRRVDVVFDQDGHAVQRASRASRWRAPCRAASAIASASGLTSSTLRSVGPPRSIASMRSRYASTSCRADSSPEVIRSLSRVDVELVQVHVPPEAY